MPRRSQVWLAVALLFLVVNLVGGVVAAAASEPLHAGVHAGLTLLAAYFVWRRTLGRAVPRTDRLEAAGPSAPPAELAGRLMHLEQSVDAVAVEVERIGEGQRFMTRLVTERGALAAPGDGAPEPIAVAAPEAAPQVRRS